jgi:hypothetical protein
MPCLEQAQMNDARVALDALAQDQPLPNQPIEQRRGCGGNYAEVLADGAGLCSLDGRR